MKEGVPVIIGQMVVDIVAGPVDEGVFAAGSTSVPQIPLGYGGDALNEATVLHRLGHTPRLASVVGADDAGRLLLNHCRAEGLGAGHIRVREGLGTSVNVVLVQPGGERSFITTAGGSLRAFSPADLGTGLFEGASLCCFASLFVSPPWGCEALAQLFGQAKAAGLTVCADTTRPKNGERAADMAAALAQLDYFFPNRPEAAQLTGETRPDAIADALLAAGVGCVVLKLGADGCLVKTAGGLRIEAPAYRGAQCIDTTGAGDSFVAGFLAGLLRGWPLGRCAGYANAVASLAVEAIGATAGITKPDAAEERHRAWLAQNNNAGVFI